MILSQEFDKYAVSLEAVTEDINNTEIGRMINYIKGFAANLEARKIAERTSRGRRAKAQRPIDNYAGGYVSFGYSFEKYLENDRYKNRVVIDPAEADIVKEIFNLYNKGINCSQIAKHLHQKHVRTKTKNGTWTGGYVWRILQNRNYIGKGKYGNVESPKPAIVDEVTFAQAQLRVEKNRHRTGRPANVTYILKGLGKCQCGGNIGMKEVKGYRYAYCSRQQTAPHKYQCFTKKNIKLESLEAYVWDEVVDFLESYNKGELAGKLYDNFEASKGHRDSVIAQARVELEVISGKKQRLLSEYVDGIFTKEHVDMKSRQLTDEQEHWQTVIDEQLALTDNVRVDELLESLKQLNNLYDWGLMTTTPEQKKEIIAKVLHEFIIYEDNRIELRFKLPVTEEQVVECVQASIQTPNNLVTTPESGN